MVGLWGAGIQNIALPLLLYLQYTMKDHSTPVISNKTLLPGNNIVQIQEKNGLEKKL